MTSLRNCILLISILIYLAPVDSFSVQMINDFITLWKHVKKKIAAIKIKNNKTTVDFLKSNGYAVESHIVRTEDGYLLTLHHIPYGKKEVPTVSTQHSKPVILLQHGFLWSSMAWVIMGSERSLSYLLADNGYDVWIGNSRGNMYSRNHTKYSPDKDKELFWNFSWHEMGYYDLSATIDYILRVTYQTKLYYIGYSMGATAYYVLMSLRPDYNQKIRAMLCLAPIVYPQHMQSPFAKVLHSIRFKLEWFLKTFNMYEVFPNGWFLDRMNELLCTQSSRFQKLCKYVLFLMIGFDYAQLNDTALPTIFLHLPAGTSLKCMVHYLQLMEAGTEFRQYDYGQEENIIHYNSVRPPAYPLHKVTTPVYMYYSQNDWLSPPKDVERLVQALPNIVTIYKVPYSKFNHLDFVWAVDVKPLLYDNIIKTLNNLATENISGK